MHYVTKLGIRTLKSVDKSEITRKTRYLLTKYFLGQILINFMDQTEADVINMTRMQEYLDIRILRSMEVNPLTRYCRLESNNCHSNGSLDCQGQSRTGDHLPADPDPS